MIGANDNKIIIDKENTEKELNNLKEAIKTGDADKIKQATESLQKASHKLAEEVYKATAAQQAAGTQGPHADSGAQEQGPQPATAPDNHNRQQQGL